VPGKTKIDEFSSSAVGTFQKWFQKRDVVVYAMHLPYDVIAGPNAVEYLIQTWQPCGYLCRFLVVYQFAPRESISG